MTAARPYCSCVCCMQAIKNAILIREKHADIDVTICYMDIRSYGKGYEEYYERAKALGVKFLRGMPSDILADRDGMVVQVENSETSELLILHPGPCRPLGRHGPCGRYGPARGAVRPRPRGYADLSGRSTMRWIRSRPCARGSMLPELPQRPKTSPTASPPGGSAAMRAYIDAIRTRTA